MSKYNHDNLCILLMSCLIIVYFWSSNLRSYSTYSPFDSMYRLLVSCFIKEYELFLRVPCSVFNLSLQCPLNILFSKNDYFVLFFIKSRLSLSKCVEFLSIWALILKLECTFPYLLNSWIYSYLSFKVLSRSLTLTLKSLIYLKS